MPTYTIKPLCLMNALSRAKKTAGAVLTGFSLSALSISGLGLSSVAQAEPLAIDAVGYIAGDLQVSQGSANYTVPIDVPPGIGQMAPQLSFTYNSKAGRGEIGQGWNLSGLSTIHRCGSTEAQDGVFKAVRLDGGDNYCLDGMRLVPINGENGADGTEYRTEIDTFNKVVSHGSAGFGPASFTVWTKSGEVIEYGNSEDSRIEASGKATVLKYALTKRSDAYANSIEYSYDEVNTSSEAVISSIRYADNEVRFSYLDREGSFEQDIFGSKIKVSKQLSKVETFSQGERVQFWNLSFTEEAPKYYTLNSLQQCTDEICYPKTEFTWQEFDQVLPQTASANMTDFDGDGVEDSLVHFPWAWRNNLFCLVIINPAYPLTIQDPGILPTPFINSTAYDLRYVKSCPNRTVVRDVNGDGLSDVILFNVSTSEVIHYGISTGQGFTFLAPDELKAQIALPRLLVSIKNSTTVNIKYANLHNGIHENSEDLEGEEEDLKGIYIVSKVEKSNAVGSNNTTSFTYSDGKFDEQGRGFLGFKWIKEKDESSGQTVQTYYRQDFPYIGRPREVVNSIVRGTVVNSVLKTYEHLNSVNEKVYFPYEKTATHIDSEQDGSLVTTIEVENDQFDAYGNLGWVKVTTTGGGETYSKTTTNTYSNDESKWHLGRLLTASVSHEHADGTTLTRNSAFEYDPVTGFLTKEIVEPGTAMEVAITTTYDDHGNKVAVSTTAAGETTPRSASITFDANGQFPISSANALGHSDSKITDNRYGVLTSQTGPNGLTTTWEYDGFGNRTKEVRADGTVSTVSRHWVNSGQCAHAPEFTSYCVISETDGSAPAEVYFDSLNRKLRTVTLGFNGQPVYKDTVYNRLGQVEKVSRAYYADALQIYWALSTYDDMGRLIKAQEPGANGVLNATSTRYNGLTTVATNPAGQSKTTVTDALGKVISVQEPEAASMSYQYDALGNLIKTTDSAGNVVTIDYDLLGRKIGMNDPDMGIWSYDYNGYGELIQQTDAKGQSSQMSYDSLGRMVKRVEPEGTSIWTYDTANKGIGKLSEVIGEDGFKKTYTYDNLGRLLDATTEADNKVLTISTEYDQYSRLKKLVRPQGFVTENVYTAQGYLQAVRGLRGQASDYQVSHLEGLLESAIRDAASLQQEAINYLDQADSFLRASEKIAGYRYKSKIYDPSLGDYDYSSYDMNDYSFAYYLPGNRYEVYETETGEKFAKVKRISSSYIQYDYIQLWVENGILINALDTSGNDEYFDYFDDEYNISTNFLSVEDELFLTDEYLEVYENGDDVFLRISNNDVLLKDESFISLLSSMSHDNVIAADILNTHNDTVQHDLLTRKISEMAYQYEYPAYSEEYIPFVDAGREDVWFFWNELTQFGLELLSKGTFSFIKSDTSYPVYTDSIGGHYIWVDIPDTYLGSWNIRKWLIKLDIDSSNTIKNITRPAGYYSRTKKSVSPYFVYYIGSHPDNVEDEIVRPENLSLTDKFVYSNIIQGSEIELFLYEAGHIDSLSAQIDLSNILREEAFNLKIEANEFVTVSTQLIALAETIYRKALLAGYWAPGSDDEYYNDYQSLIQDEQHVTFWQAKERDAEGRLARELHGNGLSTVYNYDPSNGLLLQQQTGFANFDKLRDLKYQYDELNNITQRSDLVTEVEENFTYDGLDRLISSTVVSTKVSEDLTESKSYTYDVLGNITHKSDLGDYIYDSARPHAVISAGGNSYSYDANGNMNSGAGRTLTWNSFNKPVSMAKDGKTVNFTYAPDRARYLKTDSDGSKTLYLDKLYELITKGQEVTHKQFIYAGNSLVAVHASGLDHNGSVKAVQTRYMHKDNLGSVDAITDGIGNVVERMSFDPFGARRQSNWRETTVGISFIPVLTNRGFTGHEHIDEMDLIHMNGRVYDPTLGRFISADPVIKEGFSSQNFSRYSYVLNAPNKYTDPSGFEQYRIKEGDYYNLDNFQNYNSPKSSISNVDGAEFNRVIVNFSIEDQSHLTSQNASTIVSINNESFLSSVSSSEQSYALFGQNSSVSQPSFKSNISSFYKQVDAVSNALYKVMIDDQLSHYSDSYNAFNDFHWKGGLVGLTAGYSHTNKRFFKGFTWGVSLTGVAGSDGRTLSAASFDYGFGIPGQETYLRGVLGVHNTVDDVLGSAFAVAGTNRHLTVGMTTPVYKNDGEGVSYHAPLLEFGVSNYPKISGTVTHSQSILVEEGRWY